MGCTPCLHILVGRGLAPAANNAPNKKEGEAQVLFSPRAKARSPFLALMDDIGVLHATVGEEGYAPWMGASFLEKTRQKLL